MNRDTNVGRSRMMSRVRTRDTHPEMVVRSLLHGLGFRFRLHESNLPGRPDIVLPRFRTAIFVHGCFWHQHQGCPKSKRPRTNVEFWNAKLDRNIARDSENLASLSSQSWRSLVIWECETRHSSQLAERLLEFLGRFATHSTQNEP